MTAPVTSRVRQCQFATSSESAASVQTWCNHWHPCSTQVLCCETTCGTQGRGCNSRRPTPISAIPQTHRYPCDRVLPGSVIAAVRYADGAQFPVPERDGQPRRFGNKLGTGLAISAQCHYNVPSSGRHRNCLENKDFKYHCNVFPIPRIWQTSRTQNPVLARGCGFKSHLRFQDILATQSTLGGAVPTELRLGEALPRASARSSSGSNLPLRSSGPPLPSWTRKARRQ